MVKPSEYNDADLKKLVALPEKWESSKKEIILSLTVSKEQGGWITGRILKDVDKEQISAIIMAKASPNSVDLVINLNIEAAPIFGALSFLLYEIKTRLITDYLRNMNYRRERKNNSLQ